mmetsp:Transcript_56108/g.157417  ORF Transcript_56108/g.157417 Transcript_56108/m.157417 type:complete len:237 (+) Transcript_56108:696-1406(+)
MLPRHRPMNKHHVDVLALQVGDGLVDLLLHGIGALVDGGVPDLRDEVEAIPRGLRALQGVPDPSLVAVELRAIEHGVGARQGVVDHLRADFRAARNRLRPRSRSGGRHRAHLVEAEAQQGHLGAAHRGRCGREAPMHHRLDPLRDLVCHAAGGLELLPHVIVRGGLVVGAGLVVNEDLVEVEPAPILRRTQDVDSQVAGLQQLSAGRARILPDHLQELVDAVKGDVDGDDHTCRKL